MIPNIITETSITFFAKGKPWVLAKDHPKFNTIKDELLAGTNDADHLIQLTDVRVAVANATGGEVVLTDDGLFLNGEELPKSWANKAIESPDETRVLTAHPGDRVRVEGDEEAPDGIYTVSDIDNDDVNNRIYVESEEDFFGFVKNSSIVEILKDDVQ